VTYRILADAVLVLHLAFIVFATLGGLLVLRWPRVAWVHLPVVAWGVAVTVIGGVCPLTPLEKHLRALAGEVPYRGDFISHYLAAVIYPPGLTRGMQAALGVLLLVLNVAIYLRLWHASKKGC
jgi:hypothetical protein